MEDAEAVPQGEEQLRGPAVLRARPGRCHGAAGDQEDQHRQRSENERLGTINTSGDMVMYNGYI